MNTAHHDPLILGLDFGGTKIACAVADLAGSVRDQTVIATEPDRGAEQAIERAFAAADELRARARGTLVAVGVSTMGITFDDHIELAPNVAGWSQLRLPAAMRSQYPGIPVRIDNDVKAAALAEATWGALRGADPGVYVNLGSGIAAAITLGGNVLAGAHGAAGEFGYWRRSAADCIGGPDGSAPLEEFAGGAGVRRRAKSAFGLSDGYADLLQQREPAAVAMLDEIVAEICWHVTNVAILIDAEKLVLGGGYLRTAEPLLSRLHAALQRGVPYPPALEIGRFGGSGGIFGALALAVSAADAGLPNKC